MQTSRKEGRKEVRQAGRPAGHHFSFSQSETTVVNNLSTWRSNCLMSARVTDFQVHRFPSPACFSFLRSSLPATAESLCAVNSILGNSFYYALTYSTFQDLIWIGFLPTSTVILLIMGYIRDSIFWQARVLDDWSRGKAITSCSTTIL